MGNLEWDARPASLCIANASGNVDTETSRASPKKKTPEDKARDKENEKKRRREKVAKSLPRQASGPAFYHGGR